MSTEQRIQAYYKRYAGPYSRRGGRPGLLMEIARKFKTPIREVKEILGLDSKPPWPSVLPPGCTKEATGECLGHVKWYRTYQNDPYWESRCENHRRWWQ